MHIVIIGSKGFIGSHCVKYFKEQGHDITGVDIIESKEKESYYLHTPGDYYHNVFKDKHYDVCINASGNGSVPLSIKNPYNDYLSNCSELFQLLESIRINDPACKVIHLSSAAVYGTPMELPIFEDAITNPLSPYGWHKLISEKICCEYVKLHNLKIAITRPFSVYGPGLRKQLFWDIFTKTKKQHSLELWGTGKESRDFIYIDDLLQAFDKIISNAPMVGEIYNVGTGIEITIADVVSVFCNALNPAIDVHFNNKTIVGDPINWRASIEKLKSLGFVPNTPIKGGLEKTSDWLKKEILND